MYIDKIKATVAPLKNMLSESMDKSSSINYRLNSLMHSMVIGSIISVGWGSLLS